MISDSASVTMLQLWPALSSAVDITAKPFGSAVSSITDGALPLSCSMPQLAPWVISSLWSNCGCGAHGSHGLSGWNSTAIWRSEEHTSELQSQSNLVCRLLLEKKK